MSKECESNNDFFKKSTTDNEFEGEFFLMNIDKEQSNLDSESKTSAESFESESDEEKNLNENKIQLDKQVCIIGSINEKKKSKKKIEKINLTNVLPNLQILIDERQKKNVPEESIFKNFAGSSETTSLIIKNEILDDRIGGETAALLFDVDETSSKKNFSLTKPSNFNETNNKFCLSKNSSTATACDLEKFKSFNNNISNAPNSGCFLHPNSCYVTSKQEDLYSIKHLGKRYSDFGFKNLDTASKFSQSILISNNNKYVINGNGNSLVHSKTVAGNLARGMRDINTFKLTANEESNRNFNKRIVINIGGVRFETYKTTLKLITESRLANLTETNSDYDPVKNEYFFDRDAKSFLAILNYYRTGKLHAPVDVCGNLFYEELNFWGICEQAIEPCCWTNYSTQRDCDEILRKVMDGIEEVDETEEQEEFTEALDDKVPTFTNMPRKDGIKDGIIRIPRRNKRNRLCRYMQRFYHRYRPVVWRFLDDRNSSFSASIFFWTSVAFLAISIINFVLETSSYFRVPFDISMNKSMSRKERESKTIPHIALTHIELVCNIFFSIEFLLRFLSSPDKMKFLRTPYNFFEFLAILPTFVPAETEQNKNTWGARIHSYVEVFYILRILRIFTLVPKYSGLRVLLLTIKNSLGELVLYVLMLLMAIMIFASFAYYAEQIFETDDNKFDSILIGLWWAIVTMTTLGYGDIVPGTPFGYIVGALCALTGLIFLALPIPVIVNNFTTFYAHAKARKKLKEYSKDLKGLPNRAIAVYFQTTETKYNYTPFFTSNNKDNISNNSEQLEQTDPNSQVLVNKNYCGLGENRGLNGSKSVSRTSKEMPKLMPIKKAKWIKLRKTKQTNQNTTLVKWQKCQRRTIRRNAIVDTRNEDRRMGSLLDGINNFN